MNIMDAIVNAQGGAAVRQLGAQLGLGEDQTTSALSALMPALAAGVQRNIQTPDGLGSLMSALSSGHHQRYLDTPSELGDQSAVAEGNGILGHILGNKDVSRNVASRAAAQTGLGADVMKRMLPLAATLLMGAVAKHRGTASAPGAQASTGGIGDLLGSLLDQNRDGSVTDDVTAMFGRFLGRS